MNYRLYEISCAIREFFKFELPILKLPISIFLIFSSIFYYSISKKRKAIEILSKLHRTGWYGSEKVTIFLVRKMLFSEKNKSKYLEQLLEIQTPLANTEKFFSDPDLIFKRVCLILRSPDSNSKGVILLKYSYYFPLLFKFFDMEKLSNHYHIVLEPSWAGTCEPGILAYLNIKSNVYVMAYENRDSYFINNLKSNLISVPLSSNWWVDHNVFNSEKEVEKEFDVTVISAWSRFKRHYKIFKNLSRVKLKKPNLKVALIGYPGDLKLEDIKGMAKYYGVEENLEFFEWIEAERVSLILQKSKINLLWSRFEGLNRSIIEGMFCNVPCILRNGFNYGMKYSYVNEMTGIWSTEKNLSNDILFLLDNYSELAPRDYVIQNHTCEIATQILTDTINNSIEKAHSIDNLAVKVNNLHGMEYLNPNDSERFKEDKLAISKWKI